MSEEFNLGCLVFGHDDLGHGRTTAGERALVDNMEEYTEPIIAHVKAIEELIDPRQPKLPIFSFGHSMCIDFHRLHFEPATFVQSLFLFGRL